MLHPLKDNNIVNLVENGDIMVKLVVSSFCGTVLAPGCYLVGWMLESTVSYKYVYELANSMRASRPLLLVRILRAELPI